MRIDLLFSVLCVLLIRSIPTSSITSAILLNAHELDGVLWHSCHTHNIQGWILSTRNSIEHLFELLFMNLQHVCRQGIHAGHFLSAGAFKVFCLDQVDLVGIK